MSDYSVEEIIKAKRVARENGYIVKLPNDEVEQAMNIAKSAGYTVREAPVATPAKTPEPAASPEHGAANKPKTPQHPNSWEMAARYL